MGSSTSKTAQKASKLSATNTARKYPTRAPPQSSNRTNVQPPRPSPDARLGPTIYPEVKATESKDESIKLDSADPNIGLNARLRSLGPVQPNPTLSNSSTYNFTRSPPLSHNDPFPRQSPPSATSSQPFPPTNSKTQTSSPQSQQSSYDPSLSHTQFQPSASNPAQSIFPDARQNPAVSLLTARYRIAEEADEEFAGLGRKGAKGRRFIDVQTLRQALVLRGEGMRAGEIEEKLGLREGVVARLGKEGVVGVGS
ncbi:uncharacterized protein PAC_16439 [Phialocephala subalpina]|uniref:Helix-turn-helix domain-containing protein n=1 Tax=Phialocephala subalpina TaxID=576137 RepID=A0A1L7XND8_9HELO|nr:uncharacterized protein PAC_16439 [Phialocephala subalpina]